MMHNHIVELNFHNIKSVFGSEIFIYKSYKEGSLENDVHLREYISLNSNTKLKLTVGIAYEVFSILYIINANVDHPSLRQSHAPIHCNSRQPSLPENKGK